MLIGSVLIFFVWQFCAFESTNQDVEVITCDHGLRSFLSPDMMKWNHSPFSFSNNSPYISVDRNGFVPIRIVNTVEKIDAIELHGYLQNLTNDRLTMFQKAPGKAYEIIIDRSQLDGSKPIGTRLLRELEDASELHGVSIDIRNSQNSAKAINGSVQYAKYNKFMKVENLSDYHFNGEAYKIRWIQSDAVVNLSYKTPQSRTCSLITAEGEFKIWDFQYASPIEIVLAHELIHANQTIRGDHYLYNKHSNALKRLSRLTTVRNRTPIPGNSYSEHVMVQELRTVGLTEENPVHSALEGIDRSGSISENAIRNEHGIPYRFSYRPIP